VDGVEHNEDPGAEWTGLKVAEELPKAVNPLLHIAVAVGDRELALGES
jgi:hypothetical protein